MEWVRSDKHWLHKRCINSGKVEALRRALVKVKEVRIVRDELPNASLEASMLDSRGRASSRTIVQKG